MLSLVPEYFSCYVPRTSLPEFLQPLHCDSNVLKLGYYELLEKCKLVNIDLTQNMAQLRRSQDNNTSKMYIYICMDKISFWKITAFNEISMS